MDEKRVFTVIAVQATGKNFRHSRLIAIAIVRIENGEATERFSSLINPERPIPEYVSVRTGIDDETVRNAPVFSEIAHIIDRLFQNAVIVGHQVSWDYHMVRCEFRYLGYDFESAKMCTQRLAKKVLPSLFSYEFDDLCGSLGIRLCENADAETMLEASVALFQRLSALDDNYTYTDEFLRPRPARKVSPSHVGSDTFAKLPTAPGVYRFQDSEGTMIYVGKAKNIKKRVISHFQSAAEKETALCGQTYSIDFEETGNELVALLLEADSIKKRLPEYNTIQKKTRTAYHIKTYMTKFGILQFMVEEKPELDEPSELFFTKVAAKKKLEQLCRNFRLCPKFSGLQRRKGRCNHVKFPFCNGVCAGGEDVFVYNERARAALATLKADTESYVIHEKGRRAGEQSFILVLNGVYQGFGFVDSSQQINGVEDLQDLIAPRKSTYHTTQILSAYRKKFGYRVKMIEGLG